MGSVVNLLLVAEMGAGTVRELGRLAVSGWEEALEAELASGLAMEEVEGVLRLVLRVDDFEAEKACAAVEEDVLIDGVADELVAPIDIDDLMPVLEAEEFDEEDTP